MYKTLFLDRDGVINRRIEGGYVTKTAEFEFLPGVPEALRNLSSRFGRIFIVTNQQGIGKGLFSMGDLEAVHRFMLGEIEKNGGRIDRIYTAPNLAEENDPARKPNIGMAVQAEKDFPEIRCETSVMAGDSLSDMQFGKNAGMCTVFLKNGENVCSEVLPYADFIFENLTDFTNNLNLINKN